AHLVAPQVGGEGLPLEGDRRVGGEVVVLLARVGLVMLGHRSPLVVPAPGLPGRRAPRRRDSRPPPASARGRAPRAPRRHAVVPPSPRPASRRACAPPPPR